MSSKKLTEYKLHVTDYLDKAFPNEQLPMNAIIEKGKCGIGGTYMELKDTSRKSIVVVPTIGIIEDKIYSLDENGRLKYPDLYAIYGKMTEKQIADYLINVQPQKIIITPDSLKKFVKAAKSMQLLWEMIKKGYFILFDEYHAIITEVFRNRMLDAFEQLFEFENKSFISATPYHFSDPRMQNLDKYIISFYEKFGMISIVNAKSVKAALNAILTESIETTGNVHIFYNSVTEIAEAVERAELKDCNIYCADKSENMKKLGEYKKFYNTRPTTGQYKKFNFYTSRYFEGFDLEDITPTIVLVTDIHNPHTKVGISNKGVQATGRIRTKPDKSETYPSMIYHITNHLNRPNMQQLKYFKNKYTFCANERIRNYNNLLGTSKMQGFEPLEEETEFVEKFATIDTNTGKAVYNHTKVDQTVNESTCNEVYNHIDFIREAWENANYDTRIGSYEELLKPKERKRKTKQSNKEVFEEISKISQILQSKTGFIFNLKELETQLNNLKSQNPIIYEAYQKLTIEEIESISYDIKEVQKLLILKNNKIAEYRILKMLPLYFTIGRRYTKSEIKANLQEIYSKTGYTNKAKAEDLQNNQWYEIKECKIWNDKSKKYDNGFQILRPQFSTIISNR